MDSSPYDQFQPLSSPSAWEPSHSYRVLMLAPTSFFADYGCHVRILEEARILRQLGHHVTIATYHNGGPVADLDIRRTLPIPWRRDYEVGSSRHKIIFDALLGLKALRLLTRERYDVIHAHLHEGALIGQVLSRLFGLPMVFDFQGSLTAEMIDHHFVKQGSAFYRALLRLETWLDRSSPMIVTSSAQAAHLLRDNFGCRPEQVQVLPDCVNANVFRPAASYDPSEMAALRGRLGIPPDRRLIVYLGLLAEYQGTGLLLEALQRLVQERRDAHLLLMGFPNVESYRAKAQMLGVSEFITFTGRVRYEEAPKHLALGDVAVAPKLSLTEGAGKLLNYMAVGLPTVAFDTPVARQYLGPDGLFAERGNAASLADQLHAALFPSVDSARRHRQIGWQLRQRAIQHFGWEPAGRQIVDIYRALLGDTPEKVGAAPKWAISGK
jgi:glycosyltransferase involved in cell wall biosynthesis